MKILRRFVILAVAVGLAIKLLKTLGVMDGGECSPACACSRGVMDCACSHATCLSPAAA